MPDDRINGEPARHDQPRHRPAAVVIPAASTYRGADHRPTIPRRDPAPVRRYRPRHLRDGRRGDPYRRPGAGILGTSDDLCRQLPHRQPRPGLGVRSARFPAAGAYPDITRAGVGGGTASAVRSPAPAGTRRDLPVDEKRLRRMSALGIVTVATPQFIYSYGDAQPEATQAPLRSLHERGFRCPATATAPGPSLRQPTRSTACDAR
jgi:hypothetical protein